MDKIQEFPPLSDLLGHHGLTTHCSPDPHRKVLPREPMFLGRQKQLDCDVPPGLLLIGFAHVDVGAEGRDVLFEVQGILSRYGHLMGRVESQEWGWGSRIGWAPEWGFYPLMLVAPLAGARAYYLGAGPCRTSRNWVRCQHGLLSRILSLAPYPNLDRTCRKALEMADMVRKKPIR